MCRARKGLSTVKSSNLVISFSKVPSEPTPKYAEIFPGTMRHTTIRVQYALFQCESGSYHFVTHDALDASSKQTIEFLRQAIQMRITRIPPYNTTTGYDIEVYEVYSSVPSLWPND